MGDHLVMIQRDHFTRYGELPITGSFDNLVAILSLSYPTAVSISPVKIAQTLTSQSQASINRVTEAPRTVDLKQALHMSSAHPLSRNPELDGEQVEEKDEPPHFVEAFGIDLVVE